MTRTRTGRLVKSHKQFSDFIALNYHVLLCFIRDGDGSDDVDSR